jgi:hypothetical protein
MKVLVTILFLSINSVISKRIPSLRSDNGSKVTKFFGKLINEANQQSEGIQDVAILDMAEGNGKGFEEVKQGIARNLMENPVTILPSKGPAKCTRKFSFAIIFLENFDDVRMMG